MSSFSPALLDCSRTAAAHIHLRGVCGTHPKPRQVLYQAANPSTSLKPSRGPRSALYTGRGGEGSSPPSLPPTLQRKLKCAGMFAFPPHPRPGSAVPRLWAGRSEDALARGPGAKRGKRPPKRAGGSGQRAGAAHPAAPAARTVNYFCHLATTSFRVASPLLRELGCRVIPRKGREWGVGREKKKKK